MKDITATHGSAQGHQGTSAPEVSVCLYVYWCSFFIDNRQISLSVIRSDLALLSCSRFFFILNSPESPFALLWGEVVEGFGLILTQKGFMVVVIVFVVVMFKAAERFFFMDSTLSLCWFAAAVDDAEDETRQQRPDHPDGDAAEETTDVELV